jgi:hypothetical protein
MSPVFIETDTGCGEWQEPDLIRISTHGKS